MDFRFTDEEEKFRDEVRGFLKDNPPEKFETEYHDEGFGMGAFSRDFYKKLGQAGYLSLTWPPEYGGRGESIMKQYILLEELTLAGAPYQAAQLIETVPHLIIEYGTERAKQELLTQIRSGDTIFWLGFTEPDAGSDLLNLKTVAKEEDDYFTVNGQKSCSSWTGGSDWVYLLVCTDPAGRRGRNLSLLLVDKSLPGVNLTPIRNLAGKEMHYEVFFDNVRVHRDFLIGEKNQGLPYLVAGLESDRFWGARGFKAQWLQHILEDIVRFIKDDPIGKEVVSSKSWVRNALAELRIEMEAGRLFAYRCAWMLDRGMTLTYEASALKYFIEELSVRFWHTIVEIFGPLAILKESKRFPFAKKLWYYYLLSVPVSILAGGTAEVQKDTIARSKLGIKPPALLQKTEK